MDSDPSSHPVEAAARDVSPQLAAAARAEQPQPSTSLPLQAVERSAGGAELVETAAPAKAGSKAPDAARPGGASAAMQAAKAEMEAAAAALAASAEARARHVALPRRGARAGAAAAGSALAPAAAAAEGGAASMARLVASSAVALGVQEQQKKAKSAKTFSGFE